MHVYDLAWTREGAVSGLARCGAWLSAHVSPQWGTGARAKAPWRQVPELSERLRRLTPAGRGTPGRDHDSRPCSCRVPKCPAHGEGWSRGRPRESTSQLGGRDEAPPREAPEARVRSALPHASNRACPVVASYGRGWRAQSSRLCSVHWAVNTGRVRRSLNALDPRA